MATRYFHWDVVDDCVMHETDEHGDTIVEYTREPGPFGPLLSENRGGTESYHHYDALGSTTFLTDAAGNVTDTFAYDAWGNQVARTGTTPTPYTWVGRWGYQDDSATTGGYYIRARSYEPTVARWMSVDPLSRSLPLTGRSLTKHDARKTVDISWYDYGVNSPSVRLDASGLTAATPGNRSNTMPPELPPFGQCAVSVCCHPVEADSSGISAGAGLVGSHCFVLVTAHDGWQIFYNGGPMVKSPRSNCDSILLANSGNFPGAGRPDESEKATNSCQHLGAVECSSLYSCLNSVKQWFKDKCCCYHPVACPNSNNVARTFLSRCVEGRNGIRVPRFPPTQPPGGYPRWAPCYSPLPDDYNCDSAKAS